MKYQQRVIEVSHPSDIVLSRRIAKEMSLSIGFDKEASEEIVLVVSEIASNLVKHATQGKLILKLLGNGDRRGIQIESIDKGPGIQDVELAIEDGFSTIGTLGYGLGTVNRIMDEFEIESLNGTHLVTTRWLQEEISCMKTCPLEFGVATRSRLNQKLNGDTFVIKKWNESVLVGIIDGLGHGEHAHRAAKEAQLYVERHYKQQLKDIFRGVNRAC